MWGPNRRHQPFFYMDEDLSDIKLTVFKMMIFTAEETSQEKGGGKVFRQKLPASSPLGEPSPRSLPIKLKKHAWNFQVDCLSTVMHDYTGSFVLETRRRLRLGFYANWAPNSWAHFAWNRASPGPALSVRLSHY